MKEQHRFSKTLNQIYKTIQRFWTSDESSSNVFLDFSKTPEKKVKLSFWEKIEVSDFLIAGIPTSETAPMGSKFASVAPNYFDNNVNDFTNNKALYLLSHLNKYKDTLSVRMGNMNFSVSDAIYQWQYSGLPAPTAAKLKASILHSISKYILAYLERKEETHATTTPEVLLGKCIKKLVRKNNKVKLPEKWDTKLMKCYPKRAKNFSLKAIKSQFVLPLPLGLDIKSMQDILQKVLHWLNEFSVIESIDLLSANSRQSHNRIVLYCNVHCNHPEVLPLRQKIDALGELFNDTYINITGMHRTSHNYWIGDRPYGSFKKENHLYFASLMANMFWIQTTEECQPQDALEKICTTYQLNPQNIALINPNTDCLKISSTELNAIKEQIYGVIGEASSLFMISQELKISISDWILGKQSKLAQIIRQRITSIHLRLNHFKDLHLDYLLWNSPTSPQLAGSLKQLFDYTNRYYQLAGRLFIWVEQIQNYTIKKQKAPKEAVMHNSLQNIKKASERTIQELRRSVDQIFELVI